MVGGGKGGGKGGVLFKGELFGMGCVEFFTFGKEFVCESKKESVVIFVFHSLLLSLLLFFN